MPFIKQQERTFIKNDQGLETMLNWLLTISVEKRKGYLAYIVMYLGKYFGGEVNYFNLSTGTDAVRSALNELERELKNYEKKKSWENGEV